MCEKPTEVTEEEPTEFSFPRLSLTLLDGEYHLAAKKGMTISSYHRRSGSLHETKPEEDSDINLGNKEYVVGVSIIDESTRTGYKVTKVEEDGTVVADVDIYLTLPVSINIAGHQISVSMEEKLFNISIDGNSQTIPMSEIRGYTFNVDNKTSFTAERSVHLTQKDQVLAI